MMHAPLLMGLSQRLVLLLEGVPLL